MSPALLERILRLVGLIVVGALALYLAGVNAAYWTWVANSAFRGIRAPADLRLGFASVLFASVPPAAGAATGVRSACHRRSTMSCWTRSSAVAAIAAIPLLFIAALITVI